MSRRPARRRGTAPSPAKRPVDAARPVPTTRVAGVDALRGAALCLMFVYHFSFDLRFYRVVASDFEHDPFWLAFRALIVASFMALVGISLVLSDRAGATARHFWKRIAVIAACAVAASVGSYVLFPRTFIFFGILHCIAVASVLAWPLVRRPRLALGIGIVVIVAGLAFSNPLFDTRALSWIGFTTFKPPTEDFVPLFPWAGVVLVGIAAGHGLVHTAFRPIEALANAPRWMRFIGRHSLFVYMVHQPILLGLLWIVAGR
ncbi:MAG: heparan-alpha-glucosaminide N-acetyltransferase [Casimicrobiaceae bacterium]